LKNRIPRNIVTHYEKLVNDKLEIVKSNPAEFTQVVKQLQIMELKEEENLILQRCSCKTQKRAVGKK